MDWEQEARALGINLDRVAGVRCPKCGHINPVSAVICEKVTCAGRLNVETGSEKGAFAPGAHTAPLSQKQTEEAQSYQPMAESIPTPTRRQRFSADTPSQLGRSSGRRRWIPWAIAGAVLLSTPLVYFGGYLHAFTAIRSAEAQQTQIPSIRTAKKSRPPKSPNSTPASSTQPSRAVTPPKSKPPVVPVTMSTTTTPVAAVATLAGTIKSNQLQAVVWAGLSPQGPLYPVTLMVDTGAEHTMVSGHFFQAAGDRATGQTTTYAGIGGTEQVGFWPSVWVFPHDKPVDPIIAGRTEPGGVNRTALGSESVTILLGQNIIQTGTLTQDGTTWTFTYPARG